MRFKIGLIVAAVVVTALGASAYTVRAQSPGHRSSAADFVLPSYDEPQKVVYHITEGDSLLSHHSARVLQSIRNHVNAVAADRRDLRVVLQADGIDMLRNAKKDAGLAASIDALKKDGVRFLICRNTLVSRNMEPGELYGALKEDFVGAGVAEAAKLQGMGFAYLKL